MQWYYAIDGQRLGPVPHSEFERLVQAGNIPGETLVWRQGMDQWKTLAAVMERDPAMFAQITPPPLPEVEVEERAAPERTFSPSASATQTTQNPDVPTEANYAGFAQRTAAFLVDLILWFFIWNILSNIVANRFFPDALKLAEAMSGVGGRVHQPSPEETIMLLKFTACVLFLGFVLSVLYDTLFLLKCSATPGKLLFGLRVVQTDGTPPGFARIVARCLAKGLAGLPTLCIGFLIAAFDDQKRGLHDFFCNTRVIKKR